MSAWLVLEFMLPEEYATVREFHREVIFAVDNPADRRRVEHAKYCYDQSRAKPIRMVVPECAGVLDALHSLHCPLLSQERSEGLDKEV